MHTSQYQQEEQNMKGGVWEPPKNVVLPNYCLEQQISTIMFTIQTLQVFLYNIKHSDLYMEVTHVIKLNYICFYSRNCTPGRQTTNKNQGMIFFKQWCVKD